MFGDCLHDLDFVIIIGLGNDNGLGAVGDAAPERDIARVSAHDLDHTALLMGRRCITNIVYGAHGRIYCCIKSDRIIAAGNVTVNRAGYADYIQPLMRQFLRALKGPVAAGDHQCVDPVTSADLYRFVLDLRELEFRASLSLQYGPAVLHDVRHRPRFHIYDLFIDQSQVSSADPLHIQSLGKPSADHCTDNCIHSR